MKIFMTGATGFIGKAVVLRLQREGYELAAWVRSPERARSCLGNGVEFIDAAGGQSAMEAAVAHADAIINLAGEPILRGRWNAKRRRAILDSRVGITERLVAAMDKSNRPPAVMVSASAVGYYPADTERELDERHPAGDGFLAHVCTSWEAAAAKAALRGTRVTVLRIGVVVGRGGGALAAMLPAFRAGLGGPIGTGRQLMPWIHVDDMADIIARALVDDRYAGAINAVAPEITSNRAFTQTLARTVGRRAFVPVPATAMKVALGEAAIVLTSGQRVVPRHLLDCGYPFQYPHLDEALADAAGTDDDCWFRTVSGDRSDSRFDADYLRQRKPRYILEQATTIQAPLEQVFPFFSNAGNLALLTPPRMSFQILTPGPIDMQTGTTIDYRIALGPIPMRWRTVIEEWQPGSGFVDAQHRGPYRAWWHEHRFEARGNTTEMHDRVYYAPPMGLLGRLANRLFIERMLRDIFEYRSRAIRLRFGDQSAPSASRAA